MTPELRKVAFAALGSLRFRPYFLHATMLDCDVARVGGTSRALRRTTANWPSSWWANGVAAKAAMGSARAGFVCAWGGRRRGLKVAACETWKFCGGARHVTGELRRQTACRLDRRRGRDTLAVAGLRDRSVNTRKCGTRRFCEACFVTTVAWGTGCTLFHLKALRPKWSQSSIAKSGSSLRSLLPVEPITRSRCGVRFFFFSQ